MLKLLYMGTYRMKGPLLIAVGAIDSIKHLPLHPILTISSAWPEEQPRHKDWAYCLAAW